MKSEVAVVGAGVVGSAVALALARRGVELALLEAAEEPALEASGTNSGILHTGFDSPPGELETEMILRAARLRDDVLEALAVPVLRCGAEMRPLAVEQRAQIAALERNAGRNGVEVTLRGDGPLEIPGEAVTDPVAFTLALAAASGRHGAELRTGFEVTAAEEVGGGLVLRSAAGEELRCSIAVNAAGLGAGRVARLFGDDSFEIYPRKGEFLVFDGAAAGPLDRILLPVPTKRTKGVLVFPSVDGMVIAGPTALDLERPDWSVRPEAAEEILPKAAAMHPTLAAADPVFAYAGLRPAGRGVNYVIAPSPASERLVNAAAIRSTGLTASLGIAERVCELLAGLGVRLGPERPLSPGPPPPAGRGPWWRRTAERFAVAASPEST